MRLKNLKIKPRQMMIRIACQIAVAENAMILQFAKSKFLGSIRLNVNAISKLEYVF